MQIDQYSKVRGGFSILLSLSCKKCNSLIGSYQKDGPGPLKRMYADRLHDSYFVWEKDKIVFCNQCERPLACCLVYKKENRSSFTLFSDTVQKSLSDWRDYPKLLVNQFLFGLKP